MIDWSYEVINDTFRGENIPFWKQDFDSMTSDEKDTKIAEFMAKERPLRVHSIKAVSFRSVIEKIKESLKDKGHFLTDEEKERFYLRVNPDYAHFEGGQLDIDLRGCENEYRVLLSYDSDPDQDLEQEDIDEVEDEIDQKVEDFTRRRY